MSELAAEEHVDIAAPPAEVWAYRLDFTNLPEYNPDVSGVERVEDGSGAGGDAGTGARYAFSLATEHGAHPVTLTITAAVEGREVAASMKGGMSANEVFVVEPAGDGRCRATLSLWLDLPARLPADTALELLAGGRRQIRGELDAMRAVLEGRYRA